MTQTKLRPVLREQAGLGNGICSAALSRPEYNSPLPFNQQQIDIVELLSRRTGVAMATVRAQLDTWQIGGSA